MTDRDHCAACGKAWVDHLGVQPTCQQLIETKEQLVTTRALIDELHKWENNLKGQLAAANAIIEKLILAGNDLAYEENRKSTIESWRETVREIKENK